MAKGRIRKVLEGDLISLDDAAEQLGLSPSFLRWALEGGLLQGMKDRQGEWRLPAAELEAGLNAFQEEMAQRREKRVQQQAAAQEHTASPADAVSDDQSQSLGAADPASPQEIVARDDGDAAQPMSRQDVEDRLSQTEFMRSLIEQQAESIMAKDALIAELARQIGKLGEVALARLSDSAGQPKD